MLSLRWRWFSPSVLRFNVIGSGEICSARPALLLSKASLGEHDDNIQINGKKHTNALLAAVRCRKPKKERSGASMLIELTYISLLSCAWSSVSLVYCFCMHLASWAWVLHKHNTANTSNYALIVLLSLSVFVLLQFRNDLKARQTVPINGTSVAKC